MNAKSVVITILSYVIWLICSLIIIMIFNSGISYGTLHVPALVTQYGMLIFFATYVLFKLAQQWRTRTVVKEDNLVLLVGLLLFVGTAFTFQELMLVPSAFIPAYRVEYEGAFWSMVIMLGLSLLAMYRMKKTSTTDRPSLVAQKVLVITLACYIATLLLEFTLLSFASTSSVVDTTLEISLILGIDAALVVYILIVMSHLIKERRAGMWDVHLNNVILGGSFTFAISPLIIQIVAGLIGYYAVWASSFAISHLCLFGGGVALFVYCLYMVRKIKKQAGTTIQAAVTQSPETKLQQEEEKKRQVEAKARKQAELDGQKKADGVAKQKAKDAARAKADEEKRQQADEKAKRKAEEEARKKAEADEKTRRKAEQDAQKKAEFEAEIRRRAEAEAKAKAEAEAKLRAEEDARMKKLEQLVRVSDRLAVQRMAQLLEMDAEEVWKHVPDWADKFHFRIAGEELVFNKESMDDFIASLDKEFRRWGKEGKI